MEICRSEEILHDHVLCKDITRKLNCMLPVKNIFIQGKFYGHCY